MTDKLKQQLTEAIANKDMATLIANIPYATFIGIEGLAIGEDFIFKLPKNDDNLGNPTLPAIHGGVLGGFMETSGALYVMMSSEMLTVPKVVDFSIDYLSPGHHIDSFARCTVVRRGRKIANLSVVAWQTSEDEPIATARAHFLLK
ncbi:MAG: PaaI family thioesterase [Oceanicoccus sp.]|uniref:PaaI family thioesterase n=1 Tax=Oceanicoccus sp. TaxID=2691044 RepID=UPI002626426C|nr:PaaI family thioesterase [Oceanicoccus sp.]MCP3907692.1 PaaI family thioesterase [Oceanicoccus sp.]MDG1773725.1 PaaI family thioesterase [Oceanicoccus sp.]